MSGDSQKLGASVARQVQYREPPGVVEAAQNSSPLSAPTTGEEVTAAPPPPSYVAKHVFCPRCGDNLGWVGSSWYCFTCKFKEGCCDGETGGDF